MSNCLRKEVLQSFKKLHKTTLKVLNGDSFALNAARTRINEEYKKNKHVSNNMAIAELVQIAKDVEKELRTTVIQAKEVKPGVFEAKITKETLKIDNVPFKEMELSTK